MPGVIRPMTFTDLLTAINDQNGSADIQNATDGVSIVTGIVGEIDETVTVSESVFSSVGGNLGWDQEVWGAFVWA